MAHGDSQVQGYLITEKEVRKLERRMMEVYSDASKEIQGLLAKQYARLATAAPEDYYDIMIQTNRYQELLKQVSSAYNKSSIKVGGLQRESSALAMGNNYYRNLYSLQWFSPLSGVAIGFEYLDERMIRLAVTGTEASWKAITQQLIEKYGRPGIYAPQYGTLSDLLINNRSVELKAIQREITNGLITGKSYDQQARAIDNIIGSYRQYRKDGKLVTESTGAMAKAVRIARTEGTRNLNAGSFASDKEAESQGVQGMLKEWDASLDVRTRQDHAVADNQRVGLDENFIVGGYEMPHPGVGPVGQVANCRCTKRTILPNQPERLRRGKNPVASREALEEATKLRNKANAARAKARRATGSDKEKFLKESKSLRAKAMKTLKDVPSEVFEWKDYSEWASEAGLKYNQYGRLVPVK